MPTGKLKHPWEDFIFNTKDSISVSDYTATTLSKDYIISTDTIFDNKSLKFFMESPVISTNKAFESKITFCHADIENVIFNDPATIVFWNDGTKTVVKADDEAFDKEKGLAMAIAKKFYGNKGSYFNEFKKWID